MKYIAIDCTLYNIFNIYCIYSQSWNYIKYMKYIAIDCTLYNIFNIYCIYSQ